MVLIYFNLVEVLTVPVFFWNIDVIIHLNTLSYKHSAYISMQMLKTPKHQGHCNIRKYRALHSGRSGTLLLYTVNIFDSLVRDLQR